MSRDEIDAVPIGEAFEKLVAVSGESAEAITAQLYASHNIGGLWYLMAAVGIVSAVGLYAYGRWTYTIASQPDSAPQTA